MLKILINAYACSPNMGSEPGMAWNWCINLANYCELHIITEGEFKDNIEAALSTLAQAGNMHFYYNPVSDEVRRMCWNQGDWRFYRYYKQWQYQTYEIAQEIVKSKQINIVHQLNMIGFREPGYLWKIKNVPFVWGPVDAKESFPFPYLRGASIKTKLFVSLKNFLTRLQLRYSRRVLNATKSAAVVISASSNSKKCFHQYFDINSPLINETGCYIQDFALIDKSNKEKLDILWVGKLDFRKQLGLALSALANSNNKNIQLHIVGGGESEIYKQIAKSLNIEAQCTWHGLLSHQAVQKLMQKSDLLFFSSVAEGTPHVVLESIANNLPVLCFDTCGQGDSVNEKVGVKISLSNPKQSITEFANQLNYLEANRNLLMVMSANCKVRQQELSWDNKTLQMLELYNKALKNA